MTSEINPFSLFDQRLSQLFKRDDLRGVWPEIMDAETALLAAQAFAMELKSRGAAEPVIAVGYDARTGSPELALAACRGINTAGGHAVHLGMCSSEQLYFACGRYPERFAGGIMVTASHNPAEYNGMKFVLAGGAPFAGKDLESLRGTMLALYQPPAREDLSFDFADYLLEKSGIAALRSAAPVTVKAVVAAGNGVGAAAFAPVAAQLRELGFEFQYLDEEPDGRFPNGVPNPLLPEYMARLGAAVREHHADIGIGFDGDADRAGFVDEQGCEVIPALVYALVAERKLAANPSISAPVLMRNLCCSQLLKRHFTAKGVTVVDTPVGHGQIKQLMRHENYKDRIVFAGEHSGHYFYPEFFSVDSGMMTSLLLLQTVREARQANRSISELLEEWRKNYVWSGEINWELPSREQIFPAMTAVWKHFAAEPGMQRMEGRADEELGGLQRIFAAESDYDPAALRFPDLKGIVDQGENGWWFVLRPSGNEPRLRLNVEAWGENAAQRCAEKTAEIKSLLG